MEVASKLDNQWLKMQKLVQRHRNAGNSTGQRFCRSQGTTENLVKEERQEINLQAMSTEEREKHYTKGLCFTWPGIVLTRNQAKGAEMKRRIMMQQG